MSEILTALQDVDQNCPFGFSTVCRWVQKFKSGRSKLLLKHNSGRPRSATDGINTEKVAQILNSDRRLTCDEIAYKVGLSGASHRIFTENLNMKKIAVRWVPHFLSESQKQWRVIISKELLARHTDEGEIMLKHIVLIDETYIWSFEPELKRQSSEWHTPNSPRPAKFHQSEQLKNVDDICV